MANFCNFFKVRESYLQVHFMLCLKCMCLTYTEKYCFIMPDYYRFWKSMKTWENMEVFWVRGMSAIFFTVAKFLNCSWICTTKDIVWFEEHATYSCKRKRLCWINLHTYYSASQADSRFARRWNRKIHVCTTWRCSVVHDWRLSDTKIRSQCDISFKVVAKVTYFSTIVTNIQIISICFTYIISNYQTFCL